MPNESRDAGYYYCLLRARHRRNAGHGADPQFVSVRTFILIFFQKRQFHLWAFCRSPLISSCTEFKVFFQRQLHPKCNAAL